MNESVWVMSEQDNYDYQQAWNDCIKKIYDPQPINTDLAYRLVEFAKMKPEELKDLNEEADFLCFHEEAIAELKGMHQELGGVIKEMEKAVAGARGRRRSDFLESNSC